MARWGLICFFVIAMLCLSACPRPRSFYAGLGTSGLLGAIEKEAKGDYKWAEYYYRRAADDILIGENIDEKLVLGVCYLKAGEMAEKDERFNAALDSYSVAWERGYEWGDARFIAQLRKGKLLHRMGRIADALNTLTTLVEYLDSQPEGLGPEWLRADARQLIDELTE